MKKVFSAAIAALMCSMTLMGTSAAPVSAAQVATTSISSTQQTASTLPVKITRATSYVNERMNFTLTGSVKFGEFHKVLIVQVSAKWDLFFPWVKSCYVSEGVRCARCGEHTTAWGRCGLWLSSSWGPTAGWEAGQGSSTSLKCFHAP